MYTHARMYARRMRAHARSCDRADMSDHITSDQPKTTNHPNGQTGLEKITPKLKTFSEEKTPEPNIIHYGTKPTPMAKQHLNIKQIVF